MDNANNAKLNTKRKFSLDNIKLNADTFAHLFCFLSVLFIGADLIGVNVGVNLRFDQVLLAIFALILAAKDDLRLTFNFWIIAFILFSAISTVFAFDIKRGVLFYTSIIYNVVFLFYTFSSYVKTYGLTKFIKIFRWTCYTQFAIFILQYFLKIVLHYEFPFLPTYGYYLGIPRFRLWFYEPSYFATYMIFWFAMSMYNYLLGKDKTYLKDLFFCLIMLVLCTATTGFLGIALTVALVYILWLSKGITANKIGFLFVLVFLGLIVYFLFKNTFDVFIGRLFHGSVDGASGGRISGWIETFKVFKENPLYGVGPGNYGLYLGEDAGHVPSNVTLELMATLGIFATLAFYGLTLSLVIRAIKIHKRVKSKETRLLLSCAIALIIFTIVLQANQGYLRLYHWMFFGILEGGILRNDSKRRKIKLNF